MSPNFPKITERKILIQQHLLSYLRNYEPKTKTFEKNNLIYMAGANA